MNEPTKSCSSWQALHKLAREGRFMSVDSNATPTFFKGFEDSIPTRRKPCPDCGDKDKRNFYVNRRTIEGLSCYCKKCTSVRSNKIKKVRRASDPVYRAKLAAGQKIYRENNREKIKAYHRSLSADDPIAFAAKKRAARFKLEYGITLGDYNEILVRQNGRCAICFRRPDKTGSSWDTQLNVDHCHTTKKFRGILCKSCNLGLGYFKDDIDLMCAAIAYLDGSLVKEPSQCPTE